MVEEDQRVRAWPGRRSFHHALETLTSLLESSLDVLGRRSLNPGYARHLRSFPSLARMLRLSAPPDWSLIAHRIDPKDEAMRGALALLGGAETPLAQRIVRDTDALLVGRGARFHRFLALALAHGADPKQIELWISPKQTRDELGARLVAGLALARAGNLARPTVSLEECEGEPDHEWLWLELLGRAVHIALDDSAVEELASRDAPSLRRACWQVLARRGDPRHRDLAIAMVEEGRHGFEQALEALGDHDDQESIDILINRAGADGPGRDEAIHALSKTGWPAALETCLAIMRSQATSHAARAAVCRMVLDRGQDEPGVSRAELLGRGEAALDKCATEDLALRIQAGMVLPRTGLALDVYEGLSATIGRDAHLRGALTGQGALPPFRY